MKEIVEIYDEIGSSDIRLDVYISEDLEISRSQAKKLISDGSVKINHKVVKPSYLTVEGDLLYILIEKVKEEILPEEMDLQIVYEDDYMVIVNKDKATVVHPAPGLYKGTLVNGLLARFNKLSSLGGANRPGIVHRLDKDTTGLIIVAKDDHIHALLVNMFKNRQVEKYYRALVHGNFKEEEGFVEAPIGRHPVNRKKMAVVESNSKYAYSKYRVIKQYQDYSYIEVEIETGRTHQIRVHMNYINHPIVGDPVYSKGKNDFKASSQVLHAYRLKFIHPITEEEIDIKVDIPNEFQKIIDILERRES